MKKLFFLSFVSFVVGCGVSSKPETVVKAQPTIVVEQPVVVAVEQPKEESLDLQESAYKAGYRRGRKNFMKQMNLNDDSAEFSYTSNIEDESVLQTEEYQDIMMKGYADGYHKAGEAMQKLECPY